MILIDVKLNRDVVNERMNRINGICTEYNHKEYKFLISKFKLSFMHLAITGTRKLKNEFSITLIKKYGYGVVYAVRSDKDLWLKVIGKLLFCLFLVMKISVLLVL